MLASSFDGLVPGAALPNRGNHARRIPGGLSLTSVVPVSAENVRSAHAGLHDLGSVDGACFQTAVLTSDSRLGQAVCRYKPDIVSSIAIKALHDVATRLRATAAASRPQLLCGLRSAWTILEDVSHVAKSRKVKVQSTEEAFEWFCEQGNGPDVYLSWEGPLRLPEHDVPGLADPGPDQGWLARS